MENNPILITIIVPVYNKEKTILKVLKKLSDIKNSKYSFQVIDDGPNDSTNNILTENKNFINIKDLENKI